jgi:hypothetical protein
MPAVMASDKFDATVNDAGVPGQLAVDAVVHY